MTEAAEAAVETAAVGDGRVDLGERLKAIRLLRRRTLKDVADAAGVSESFVSQVERGRSSASVATLQRLAAALGIEISDLFATEGLPRPRVLRREARQLLVDGNSCSRFHARIIALRDPVVRDAPRTLVSRLRSSA